MPHSFLRPNRPLLSVWTVPVYVDFVAEAADLAKNQILAQLAATAMLAQASAISQNVLGLLS